MFGLTDDEIHKIKSLLETLPEITHIILFGSRAMGNHKAGSDVDIALKGSLTLDTLTKASYLLNEELNLPYFFDLLDYNTIENSALKTHVDTYGKVL
ncbi:MAG: nucleotidyltransferase domain-containing protein [Campylobacterota bacterium]